VEPRFLFRAVEEITTPDGPALRMVLDREG
jgi:hypothetical protein